VRDVTQTHTMHKQNIMHIIKNQV